MKPRQIRMLDSEWEDTKFVGTIEVRRLIVKAAKKKRSASSRIAGPKDQK